MKPITLGLLALFALAARRVGVADCAGHVVKSPDQTTIATTDGSTPIKVPRHVKAAEPARLFWRDTAALRSGGLASIADATRGLPLPSEERDPAAKGRARVTTTQAIAPWPVWRRSVARAPSLAASEDPRRCAAP